jgi:hypothetical protein
MLNSLGMVGCMKWPFVRYSTVDAGFYHPLIADSVNGNLDQFVTLFRPGNVYYAGL